MESKMCHYDVAIIGGGMVGLAMAAKLAAMKEFEQRKIILIERGPRPAYKPDKQFLTRVVVINENARTLLEDVGAWAVIENKFCRVTSMRVWEEMSSSSLHFDRKFIGFSVENELLRHSALTATSNKGNVKYSFDTCAELVDFPSNESSPSPAVLDLGAGETISCDLVIGADGCNSGIRDRAGLPNVMHNYGQSVVVGNASLAPQVSNFGAWQKFTKTGPIAMFPTTCNTVSLAWYMRDCETPRVLALTREQFVEEYNLKMSGDSSVPLLVSADEVRAIPVNFQHAVRSHGHRVVLIGDAAHRVNPMAGQGVNLGYGDVRCLGETLGGAVRMGEDIGAPRVLSRYSSLRRPHTASMTIGVELVRMFFRGTNNSLVKSFRSTLVGGLDRLPSAKSLIMSFAQR